jgi:hypothetical protein
MAMNKLGQLQKNPNTPMKKPRRLHKKPKDAYEKAKAT